jgi:hypothetical protein
MRNRMLLLATICIVAGLFALSTTRPAIAEASQALQNVLSEMRGLSNSDFQQVTAWARNGAPKPFMSSFQPQRTQADILDLGRDDRDAVLYWLRGSGRAALYGRGATDAMIGSRQPASGPVATPTPNPWRELPLASASLDSDVVGQIKILGGFAAAERNGKGAIACISFENLAPKKANNVVFEFPLLSADGAELGKLTLDRRGEFSPNVAIRAFDSMSSWQSGSIGPRGRADNCIQRNLAMAAVPILEARASGYRVVKVTYDDGTSWPP